ncbi:MAG: deoxyguanosinetriphosphate triphosphohydrolase [Sulfurovum sp.]|nr:deoxyguanosinetriphosphate triphosphohydrolase [Sulfurovum sp.]MCB4745059.1 deoxyguanosinetriphosphate triphosphohydrolase [Sulfurovum sp.]MCB4746354.1 deoxyguanosinetriphosphate triphosphohydrolase [Sulfurovum sp.]MCB4747156.1 deoxyguanosinetriphosphate triphosphohydrolase [Sulfurovum sp.]MCB4748846.1 deoxyguanosinetriphosphate triphosphohydrolase [Sulfurovum sp.]
MQPCSRFHTFKEDFRDPFSRDRDRVIHCSSFRRLEYKTQVFLNHEGDYFRTRLTHSLEVSQIARTLSQILKLNETLAEVIALSHDLGHTPFGHIGGDELDRLLKSDGHKMGFEHNFQSFRVLIKLEKRYKNFDGLNLTFATLEGVLKHSYPYKKPFLHSLNTYFELEKHPSLEAMVVDHADEIAYTSHDIDDGVKYGLISFDDLLEVPLCLHVDKNVQDEGIGRGESLYRHRFVAELIKLLVEDFIEYSKEGAQKYRQTEPIVGTIDASLPLPVGFSKEMATQLKILKKLLLKNLYRHEKIAQKMYAGKQCIIGLYKAFSEDNNLLPSHQKVLMEIRPKHRVIADHIAMMTDRYAMKTYHELYGLGL